MCFTFGKNMTLFEIFQQIDSQDAEGTIYAQAPWTLDSKAAVAIEGSEEEKTIKESGMEYFLEIFIATDFLTDWKEAHSEPLTSEAACNRLILYAINDA